MKVCIYGCGAIGGLLAARLTRSEATVTCIARGAHLDAMRDGGLTLVDGESRQTVAVRAVAEPAEAGPQDVVFLTMKSHSVPRVADAIVPLLDTGTSVVTASNGLPWWYFYGLEEDYGAPELTSVDPGRRLWEAIGPERAIGCVVYPAARIASPGVVEHVFGDRFSIGEPDGTMSDRVVALSELLAAAGFDAPVLPDIRVNIWTKLVANAAFNPVSLITGRTLAAIIDDDATRKLLTGIMEEVTAVARSMGIEVAMSPDELLDATRQLGDHKTSMLQDFEAGRSVELGPIAGALLEFGTLRGVETPNLRMVFGIAASKADAGD